MTVILELQQLMMWDTNFLCIVEMPQARLVMMMMWKSAVRLNTKLPVYGAHSGILSFKKGQTRN